MDLNSLDPRTPSAVSIRESGILTLVAGGDVHWSDGIRGPNVNPARHRVTKVVLPFGGRSIRHPFDTGWKPVPNYFESPNDLMERSDFENYMDNVDALWNDRFSIDFQSVEQSVNHPFENLRTTFHRNDLCLVNLV